MGDPLWDVIVQTVIQAPERDLGKTVVNKKRVLIVIGKLIWAAVKTKFADVKSVRHMNEHDRDNHQLVSVLSDLKECLRKAKYPKEDLEYRAKTHLHNFASLLARTHELKIDRHEAYLKAIKWEAWFLELLKEDRALTLRNLK